MTGGGAGLGQGFWLMAFADAWAKDIGLKFVWKKWSEHGKCVHVLTISIASILNTNYRIHFLYYGRMFSMFCWQEY